MVELIKNLPERFKDFEESLKAFEERQIIITDEDLKLLIESDVIPKKLKDWLVQDIQKMQKEKKQMMSISDENRNKPFKSSDRPLTKEEKYKLEEELFFRLQILHWLFQNKKILKNNRKYLSNVKTLFNNIDPIEKFGIVNCISNSLYHLIDLLNSMTVNNLYETTFEAKSSITNSKGELISLSYIYQATSNEEADRILKNYLSIMRTKGIKILMAYWLMANKTGRVEYHCSMTEIMKLVSDDERVSFFSVKEKEEFWALTKMIAMSKLSRDRNIKKPGGKGDSIQWIEQPLLEIIGGIKEINEEKKYPTFITIRVLMPKNDPKGFAPTIYRNKTIQLSPSDILLAFLLQTRAGQRGMGSKDIYFDWKFIFEAGNLQTTAITNQRVAKAKARKKMDRLKKSEIIEKWDEELMGVCVTPKKQKKKPKEDDDKKNIT
jgi:hypothetical protein